MAALSKTVFLFALFLVIFIQATSASIYSQLQFIKISEPKNGQDFKAGQKLKVKYVMQPLVKSKASVHFFKKTKIQITDTNYSFLDSVSLGKALKLDINFHKRTGSKKQQKIAIIHKSW
jgi:hypothetical protein